MSIPLYYYFDTIGKRSYMEDRTTVISIKHLKVFIVMDGHGGEEVVSYAIRRLPELLNSVDLRDVNFLPSISQIFLQLSQELRSKGMGVNEGTTVTMALIDDDIVYIVNLGDSRVVGWNGELLESEDHTPKNPMEAQRLRAQKASIVNDRILSGSVSLAVSRALGDFTVHGVTPMPQVYIWERVEYLAIASDGLWEKISSEEVMELMRTEELSTVGGKLSKLDFRDNASFFLIDLKNID